MHHGATGSGPRPQLKSASCLARVSAHVAGATTPKSSPGSLVHVQAHPQHPIRHYAALPAQLLGSLQVLGSYRFAAASPESRASTY